MYQRLTFYTLSTFQLWLIYALEKCLIMPKPILMLSLPGGAPDIVTMCVGPSPVHVTVILKPQERLQLIEWCQAQELLLLEGSTYYMQPDTE
jgi:hypothetical protein